MQPVLPAPELDVKESVKDYYGKVLTSTADLRTSACTTSCAPSPAMAALLRDVPFEVKDKYYGCGSPLPPGITGLRVLDLGCGSGRDCYVAAKLVGATGFVTGVDMTPAQLSVAQSHLEAYTADVLHLKAPNMRFLLGEMEKLDVVGIPDASIDLVISNCVINLSSDKFAVLREVFRVLAPGGEMYFSDVYCDRRLPREVQVDPIMLGECLGGALYTQDFIRLCREAGFPDPRILTQEPIIIHDAEIRDKLGDAAFVSATYRLFKMAPGRLESLCEDYGQVAVYRGTIPGHPHAYELDDHHRFVSHKPMLVCGNTASMVGESWLAKHFAITGDRNVHYGLFPCNDGPATPRTAGSSVGACC